MTVLTTAAGTCGRGRDRSRRGVTRVELFNDWKQAAARWDEAFVAADAVPGLPLAWGVVRRFRRASNRASLSSPIAGSLDRQVGVLLPLVRRRAAAASHHRIRRPRSHRLQRAAARSGRAARAGGARRCGGSCSRRCAGMPGGADLIRLRKMPLDLDGRPNPLALLDGAGPCAVNGNLVTTGEDFDAWRHSLDATSARDWKELARVHAAIPQPHSGSSRDNGRGASHAGDAWKRSRARECSISD